MAAYPFSGHSPHSAVHSTRRFREVGLRSMTNPRKESRPLFQTAARRRQARGAASHDVVTLTRRVLGVSRIGHTGTLDPLATGVLPLVIGRATRLAQFLTASDKSYEATIAFGRTTDTYDAKGREVSTCPRRPTARRARRRAAEVPRRVRADPAGVFREEHRRRAVVRARAQSHSIRRSARRHGGRARAAEGRTGHRAPPRGPVVRRRDGATVDAGDGGLLRPLPRARSRRGARLRRRADRAPPDALRGVRARARGAAGRGAAVEPRATGGEGWCP